MFTADVLSSRQQDVRQNRTMRSGPIPQMRWALHQFACPRAPRWQRWVPPATLVPSGSPRPASDGLLTRQN